MLTEQVRHGRAPAFSFEEKVIAFWAKVDRSGGPDACWTWTGAVTSKWNYGCFSLGNNVVRGAHKLAWLLTNGETNGLCVCHRCDNRLCCNPAHMFLGTKKDNNDDKLAKGRNYSKLNADQVREIKRAFEGVTAKKLPNGAYRDIAAKYGVGEKTIWEIRTGRKWSHVQ